MGPKRLLSPRPRVGFHSIPCCTRARARGKVTEASILSLFLPKPKASQESNSSNNTSASSKSSSKFQTDLSNLSHGNLPIADQGSQTRCSWRSARSSRRAPLVYLGTSHPSRRRTPLLRQQVGFALLLSAAVSVEFQSGINTDRLCSLSNCIPNQYGYMVFDQSSKHQLLKTWVALIILHYVWI